MEQWYACSKRKAEIITRRYHRCFGILDTDKIISAGFYLGLGAGMKEVEGMALLINALETIYYKNAARLYPHVILPCKTSDFPSPATRPLNSRFDYSKIQTLLSELIEHWQKPPERFLGQL